MFYHIRAFRRIRAVLDKSIAADITAALVSSRLDYANSIRYCSPLRCLTRLQCIQNLVARIVLQQPSLSSRDTLQQLQWLPVKWQIQFKLASLTYSLTHRYSCHIWLNTSIPTFLLAPCDHHPLLTCTSLAIIFISVHTCFILQFQQSGILSLLLFVRLKPYTLSKNILKPIFSSLHLIAPSDLSSGSDSFYWIILLTYLYTCSSNSYISYISVFMFFVL